MVNKSLGRSGTADCGSRVVQWPRALWHRRGERRAKGRFVGCPGLLLKAAKRHGGPVPTVCMTDMISRAGAARRFERMPRSFPRSIKGWAGRPKCASPTNPVQLRSCRVRCWINLGREMQHTMQPPGRWNDHLWRAVQPHPRFLVGRRCSPIARALASRPPLPPMHVFRAQSALSDVEMLSSVTLRDQSSCASAYSGFSQPLSSHASCRCRGSRPACFEHYEQMERGKVARQ